MVIGGYAVGHYASPRFTKDLDLLVESTPDNLARVYRALAGFGAPVRVDILQRVDGVDFDDLMRRSGTGTSRTDQEWRPGAKSSGPDFNKSPTSTAMFWSRPKQGD